jgi:hypothetical protein
MNKVELKAELDRIGLDPNIYSLNGEAAVGRIALSETPDGKWCVYYYFPGKMLHAWPFNSESAACENLLKRLSRVFMTSQKYGQMNKQYLKAELDLERINPRGYALDGSECPDDRYVLSHEPNAQWAVFYSERGNRLELVYFDSEALACEHLLDWVLSIKDRFGSQVLL